MTSIDPRLPELLLLEDDPATATIIQIWLKGICNITLVQDGNETLEKISSHYLSGKLFDLMLFDINIPYPWNGITLMNEIRKHWDVYNSIPFIAETAYALPEDRFRILEAGFCEYFSKPLSREPLVEGVKEKLKNQLLA
ncbi:MAG: response regulator [bacterium]